jgi:hypothetical protein
MKRNRLIKKVSADLDLLRFPAVVEHPVSADCLNCSLPLSLSQPDFNSPERLLGICERCKHWFLIDLIPDLTEGVLSRLPDIEVIRALSFENGSKETLKRSNDRTV